MLSLIAPPGQLGCWVAKHSRKIFGTRSFPDRLTTYGHDMKKGFLNLAVFWIAVLVGTVVSGVSSLYIVPVSPAALLASTRHWWEPLKVIGGYDADGVDGNDHLRELSDGTNIRMSCSRLASESAATATLHSRLASATEIISRTDNLDDRGLRVGETVVAKTSGVVRLSTYNNNFSRLTRHP